MKHKKTCSFTLRPSTMEIIETQATEEGLPKSEIVDNAIATMFALKTQINRIQRLSLDLAKELQEFSEAGM